MIGHGVPQNVHLAAESYERAANAGDPGAQNQIGYLYQTGIGVQQNMERAVHWYQLSAANGSSNGKVNLAVAYVWGLGVRANPKLGESLLEEASRKGNGVAAAYLGDMYLAGIGSSPDIAKAAACYEHGVKLHSYYAEYKLGLMLSKPDNHPQNLERSVSLLRKSVAQGYVPAMYLLGLIAVNHPDSNVPHPEALTLLRDASDAGLWKASAVLGVLSRDGKWVRKDKDDAYRYFKRAELQGGDLVKTYVHNDLQALTPNLDPSMIEKLNTQAVDWESKHSVPLQMIFKPGQKLVPFNAYALSSSGPGQHVGVLVSPIPD
jgi:TPR repeat protein